MNYRHAPKEEDRILSHITDRTSKLTHYYATHRFYLKPIPWTCPALAFPSQSAYSVCFKIIFNCVCLSMPLFTESIPWGHQKLSIHISLFAITYKIFYFNPYQQYMTFKNESLRSQTSPGEILVQVALERRVSPLNIILPVFHISISSTAGVI